MAGLGACFCWALTAVSSSSHDLFLNGIQEVVGSIPIGSTKFLNGLWVTDRPEASQL
jgi:hypothetical protein